MAIKHYLIRFLVLSIAISTYTLQAGEIATQSIQTSVSFSPKARTITVKDLSVHTILTIIYTNIHKALEITIADQLSAQESNNLDTIQKLEFQKQVLTALQKFFGETTALLDYIVHNVINIGVFKFNPDIEYKFINTYSCIDESELVQPRHLRLLKDNIQSLNKYISDYCLTRKNQLTTQEIAAFAAITKLNNSMLDCILKDEFMGIDYWDRLVDNCFYRPWEWICAHKRLVFFASILTIGLILYYHMVICKPKVFENNNKLFDVRQFEVIDQNGNVCGYHSFYNVAMLLAHDDANVLKKKLHDKNRLNKLLPKNKKNYELDAQEVEERLLKKNPLNFSDRILRKMVVLPSIDPLENIADRDDLIADFAEKITSSDFLTQLNTFKNGKNGEKIGFMINTGKQGLKNGDLVDTSGRVSHWIGAVFTKDATAKRGLSIAVTDSLHNMNRTDDQSITLIAEKILQ